MSLESMVASLDNSSSLKFFLGRGCLLTANRKKNNYLTLPVGIQEFLNRRGGGGGGVKGWGCFEARSGTRVAH